MKARSPSMTTRFIIALAVTISASGRTSSIQEPGFDWDACRKACREYFVHLEGDGAERFIQRLPKTPFHPRLKDPAYYGLIDDLFENLGTLEQQLVRERDVATRVAFALYGLSDGRLDHSLDTMLGDRLRADPARILRGLLGRPESLRLSLDYGYLLCDGDLMSDDLPPDESCRELGTRVKALETVKEDGLLQVRDQCVAAIWKEISRQAEFARSHSSKVLTCDVMDEFLRSPYAEARKRAYDHISERKEEFLPVLRRQLDSWRDRLRSIRRLEKLLGLTALFRNSSLVPPLEEMLDEPEFEWHCLYSCPLTFVMSIYGALGIWDPASEHLGATVITDIRSLVGQVKAVSCVREDPRDHIEGPGVDGILNRMVKLDERRLIHTAGAENPNGWERTTAAYVLEYTVESSRNLRELYWLAIDDIEDASAQYRSAIYWAIYRAERARLAGK